MMWFFVADRTSLLVPEEKEYVRDRFAFVFLTLILVAGWTSTAKVKVAVLLNRQQTEEWKGWMQARGTAACHCALSSPSPAYNPQTYCMCGAMHADPVRALWHSGVLLRRACSPLKTPLAGAVPVVPLLQRGRDVQRHPRVHRRVCVDDGLRQLPVLLQDQRLQRRQVRIQSLNAAQLNIAHCSSVLCMRFSDVTRSAP